jgi:hypothetical protein
MILEIALALCLQNPRAVVDPATSENKPILSFKNSTEKAVLTVEENKITWSQYCKMVEKEAQDKLGADFVVAFRPTQKPKFPVKLGGHFDLEKQVFIIDVLVDDPEKK